MGRQQLPLLLLLALLTAGSVVLHGLRGASNDPYSEILLPSSGEPVAVSAEVAATRETSRYRSTASLQNPSPDPGAINPMKPENLVQTTPPNENLDRLKSRNGGMVPALIHSPDGTLRAVTGRFNTSGSNSIEAVENLLTDFPGVFGIGDKEKLVSTLRTSSSADIVRVTRFYRDLPVWGRELVVTMEDGYVTSVTGRMKAISNELDITGTRDRSELSETAIAAVNGPEKGLSVGEIEVGIYIAGEVPVHAARVRVNAGTFKAWDIFVSIPSGELLANTARFYQVSTESSGLDLNGVRRDFSSFLDGNRFYLIDRTFTGIPDSSIIDWQDGENFVYASSASADTGWDQAAVSAIHNARRVHDYYTDTHNRVSFDNAGTELRSVVNVTGDYEDNAFWYSNTMYYGAGFQLLNFAISLDVAAHEFTHGVIEAESNLRYQNQSGALNESFADFFGVMVERKNWLIGEELFPNSNGFFRSMVNPQSGNQPAHFDNYFYTTLDNDHGGVHTNSGIQNRALYLIAQGLSDEGLGVSIGVSKTERIVYETLLRLSEDAEFIDSAIQMELQAERLYGADSAEVLAVTQSWEAVGITAEASTTREIDPDAGFSLSAGDEILVHLFPRDGTLDDVLDRFAGYDVYVAVVNQPYEGYNEDLLIGPINEHPAQGIKPSVATLPSGDTFVSYTGLDGNAYTTFIAEGTEDAVFDLDDDIAYTALTADYSKFAIVFDGDHVIWVYDFDAEQWESFEVVGPDYTEDRTGVEVEIVDAISFNYAGNKIIFDYSSCVPDPDEPGSCISIWGIGVLDLVNGFSYPFPNQRTDVDLGFPSFSRISNDVIVFDIVDYADFDEEGRAISNVLVYEIDSQEFHGIANSNGSDVFTYSFGIPTFVADDEAVAFTFQEDSGATLWQAVIDENYEPVADPFVQLLPYDSGLGQPHRNAYQEVFAELETSESSIDFGPITVNATATGEVTASNAGNRTIELLNIEVPQGVVTNLTNTTLEVGESIAFDLSLDAGQLNPGTWTGNLRIAHDGDNGPVDIGLTAVVEESTDYDEDGEPNDIDLDDDNDGVPDDQDAFPRDESETLDSDGDGVGNNEDTDDDNDQVPDSYEENNGLDPLRDDADEDNDGDGLTNYDEYLGGSDPLVSDAAEICGDPEEQARLPALSSLPLETRIPIVNPGSNLVQQTFLRFVNPANTPVNIEIYGIDDSGEYSRLSPISFSLAAGAAKQLTAQDLEGGSHEKQVVSSLCDLTGKWQLVVRADGSVEAGSLIRTPDGFLTSLNAVVPSAGANNLVYFANPASNSIQQTFLRIVNLSDAGGTATITGVDDTGETSAPASLALSPNASIQLTSTDLENGNSSKGMVGSLGNGTGKWRLTISSDLDLAVASLIRTPDGFLTNLSGVAPEDNQGAKQVYFVYPASEQGRETFLRVINLSDEAAEVEILGRDDSGMEAPGGPLQLTVAPAGAIQLLSSDLEQGNPQKGLSGALGQGSGQWRLTLNSDVPVEVMSLVRTPDGFLTNLSEVTPAGSFARRVFILNPGSNTNQQSRLRLINDSGTTASVMLTAVDDDGEPAPGGPMEVSLDAFEAFTLTAAEMESGCDRCDGALGDGTGKWHLTITSDGDVEVQSLLEAPGGFITNLSVPLSSNLQPD